MTRDRQLGGEKVHCPLLAEQRPLLSDCAPNATPCFTESIMTIKLGGGGGGASAKHYRRDGAVALMSITMGFAWTSQTILAVNCECPVSG